MSRKLVISDGRIERELLVVGTMIVGRDPECEISSGDPRLSRRHAEFRVTDAGVVVRDLNSRNGVRVNDEPAQLRTLQPGDVVQVAHLSLRFVDDSAAPTTEVAAASAPTAAMPVVLAPEVADDRTRVLAGRPGGATAPRPARRAAMPPTEVGDIVIRDEPSAPAGDLAPPVDLGVQGLAGIGWGRRVLLQGLLLALVVFLMTVIPIVAWQLRVFGVSAMQVWPVLLPPFAASAFAGVMVAALIARTTMRGAGRGR